MKNDISFKMWLTVFFGGIWQFIRYIFSWKNKTPFWRVILLTNTICVIAIIYMFVSGWFKESMYRSYRYSTEYTSQYEYEDVVVEEVIDVEDIDTITNN